MKKFLLMLVICVSSFLIYTNNVKAQTYNTTKHYTDNYITCSTGYSSCMDNLNIFNGLGNKTGTLLFTFVNDPQIILNGVSVSNSTGTFFPCDIGSSTIYRDNTTGYNLYSAVCPVTFDNNGIYRVRFTYDDSNLSGTGFKFFMSDYYSFTEDTGSIDYSSILNSINSSINSINSSLGTKIDDTNTYINTLITKITTIDNRLRTLSTTVTGLKNKTEQIYEEIDNIIGQLNDSNTTQTQIKDNVNDIKNDIKSDDTSGAEGSADDLKNNSAFQDNTGLSGVISMPLTFVNSLTNTCQPINLNIPYMDVDVTIPCMQSVITDKMPLLANLIKIIVNGFIVYRILLDIFQIVRNAKNPEDDRIEVLDL